MTIGWSTTRFMYRQFAAQSTNATTRAGAAL
jgi:hypothetical protein